MRRENLVMILIHYFVNLFMLGPLFVTGDFWKPAKSDSALLFSGKCVREAPREHQRWVEHLRQGEGGGLDAHHLGVGHALGHPPRLHPWHPPCFCLSEVSPPVEKNPWGNKQQRMSVHMACRLVYEWSRFFDAGYWMGARVQASTWGPCGPSNRNCYFVQDPHEEAKDSPKTFVQEMDISEVTFANEKEK